MYKGFLRPQKRVSEHKVGMTRFFLFFSLLASFILITNTQSIAAESLGGNTLLGGNAPESTLIAPSLSEAQTRNIQKSPDKPLRLMEDGDQKRAPVESTSTKETTQSTAAPSYTAVGEVYDLKKPVPSALENPAPNPQTPPPETGTTLPSPTARTISDDNFSAIAENISDSASKLPGLLTALAYLLGLGFGVWGIIKIKDHVEVPTQNPLREGVIRLAAGGAFFALPMIFEAMANTIGLQRMTVGRGNSQGTTEFVADVTDIAENIIGSVHAMPAFIAVVCYLLGLLFGVTAIVKLKAHVENAQQAPLRVPVIRFIVGGAFFALPTIYNAMAYTIAKGNSDNAEALSGGIMADILTKFSGWLGDANDWLNENTGGLLGGLVDIPLDLNTSISSILNSIEGVPNFIMALAYLLGVLLGAQGLLKIKEHVENPDQNPMREGVIRLLVGGAFLSIGTIYKAMTVTISNGNPEGRMDYGEGTFGKIKQFIHDAGNLLKQSEYDDNTQGCGAATLDSMVGAVTNTIGNIIDIFSSGNGGRTSDTLGTAFCNVISHAGAIPSLLTFLAYIFGMVLGFWGLLKIRDHVINPQQASIWDGVMRLTAGGAFFSLPFVVNATKTTVAPSESFANALIDNAITGYGVDGNPCGNRETGFVSGLINSVLDFFGGSDESKHDPNALSTKMYCAVTDVMAPMHMALNFFATIAGTVLIMIGISRLIKGAQDGPRGPGGLGTMFTFVTGGVLLSYNHFMRMFTTTLFGTSTTTTNPLIAYEGFTAAEKAHAYLIIGAILKFMIIIGLISFVRGIFIIRGVAEGNQQSSLMAGMTHMIGGALAVNLGPLLNLVQNTLGIAEKYGIWFT